MTAVLNGMSEFLQTTTSQPYQKQDNVQQTLGVISLQMVPAGFSCRLCMFTINLTAYCHCRLQNFIWTTEIVLFLSDSFCLSFGYTSPFYKNNQNPTKGFWSIYMNISKAVFKLLIRLFFIVWDCIALLKQLNCYIIQFNCFLCPLDNFILPYIFIYCPTTWK